MSNTWPNKIKRTPTYFRLRREGIETKVVTEHRESETEDPTRVSSSYAKQHKTLYNFTIW